MTIKKGKEVYVLNPKDHRGFELKVNRETDVGCKCDKYEGVEYQLFKLGPGWSFPNADRFFTHEGIPMTTYFIEEEEHSVTVPEFLKFAWGGNEQGENLYSKLPTHLKEPLEGKWLATVTVKPIELDPTLGLDRIKANAILREHNIEMMEDFARSEPKPEKLKKMMETILPLALGFFAGIVANMKGWF